MILVNSYFEALPRAEISCPVRTSVTVLGDIGFHLSNR